jgi:hypothetical protein
MIRPIGALLVVLAFASCGGSQRGTQSSEETVGSPRPGPAPDLMALVPTSAVVVLHTNLTSVRQDPARYDRIASELAAHLGLSAESATLRSLLDRTEEAIGVFIPSASGQQQEGMLIFSGRFADSDFDRAVQIASSRHGSTPTPQQSGDRVIYAFGNAALVRLDTWTWAVAEGEVLRAHLGQAQLFGSRQFNRDLIEFGPRIGLPQGSTQAWASQDTEVGADMVGLVFQGENPQMVANFVTTVRRHLGL